MDYLLFLSIPVALSSILNKIFLVLGRRSGWTWGAIVGLSSALYFFIIGLHVLSIAEIGFFFVMVYGYFNHSTSGRSFSFYTSILLSLLSIVLMFSYFSSYLTLVETTSSLSFIWGGYLLTTNRKSLGWILFIVAHLTTAISTLGKGELLFAILQIISTFICTYGFRNENLT